MSEHGRRDGADTEVDRIACMLMAEWEHREGKRVNVSYVATFADMARVVVEDARTETARLAAEVEDSRSVITDLRQRIEAAEAGAMAANDTKFGERVDHVELNGHIENAEACRDYLEHEAMDSGDPSGKLRDFVTSLDICIQQLDRTRRRLNWFEVAYTAGRRKVIEGEVDRALTAARQRIAELEGEAERLKAMSSGVAVYADHRLNDMRAQRDTARREAARMRPVFEAAVEWRAAVRIANQIITVGKPLGSASNKLIRAIDTALAAAAKDGGE